MTIGDGVTNYPAAIEHAGLLADLATTPGYLMPRHELGAPQIGKVSCSFCGVGDGGTTERLPEGDDVPEAALRPGAAILHLYFQGGEQRAVPVTIGDGNTVALATPVPYSPPGGVVVGNLEMDGEVRLFEGREVERVRDSGGGLVAQHFRPYHRQLVAFKEVTRDASPTTGCVKFRQASMRQRAAYPIHVAPSVLDRATGKRVTITYAEAIQRLGDMLLQHRAPGHRTLAYASGQLDYFTIFAMQEVLRLLGIRNLTGNAEHCLNAGAVHNEILTGQEGPFLNLQQSTTGPGRFYIFNGWNGFVTHPPVFRAISTRPDFDAFLVEVAVTESAKVVAKQLGKERVLLIRPKSDPHLALAVANEILTHHAASVSARFIDRFSAPDSYARFVELAGSAQFTPDRVAERIAPEPEYVERLHEAIRLIAAKMATPGAIPINIPSVGLSQTSGVVAHCLWGNVMAMVGKFGIGADGVPAGGTLRVPGQINAESEVQGLSRKYFMGRIPFTKADDAAARMGLPPNAYDAAAKDTPRAALDYSDPTPGERELFLCIGTQFEANMMGRKRWLDKLRDPSNTLVVIDPIPDPFTEANAELIIPSPPHPATTKLYQNGEWKMTLSVPQKIAAPETRSDAAILYDVMENIGQRLAADPALAAANADLAAHVTSGYVAARFGSPDQGGGLIRIDGEVSRPQLWDRIQAYMAGGSGPLYCRPEHADGRAITWEELLERGSVYYGGVGTTRFKLDYDDPNAHPFRDIYRNPGKFKFFVPTGDDLEIPEGIILNSGRTSLSDDRERIAFATSTFNSGKATPIANMPDEHPLYVSPMLAEKRKLKTGDRARVTSWENGASVEFDVCVSDRVKGNSLYVSFHKSRAQMERGVYVNELSSHEGRCAYSAQTTVKATSVRIEKVETAATVTGVTPILTRRKLDTTLIDPTIDLPIWTGQGTPLYVTEILQETHDVFTFRFQGDPLCRFAYWPGQFCSLVLSIDGKKVVRSYSISSTPTRPFVLEITVKRVPGGLVSNWLPDNLKVGDKIDIAGPKGKFHLTPGSVPPKIMFLSAGSGVTPLMSMSRWLCDISADVDVRFFNSVRSPDDIIFGKELEMMTHRYGLFSPINVSSSRATGHHSWTGMTGRISTKMLELVAPDLHERHVYMCGPQGFMDAARDLLAEMKFDLANLHSESFGGLRTSTANKEGPGEVADGAPAGNITIQFAKAGKTAMTDGKLPLLDVGESEDVEMQYGCRAGSCGDCKVRLLSGEVDRGDEDGITKADREAGFILSCVARPRTNCVLDA